MSPHATRLACLAAASWSFDVAADRLHELVGLRLDDDTLRLYVESTATQLAKVRAESMPAADVFCKAQGEAEFLTDGVFVPTRNGWRELKLGLFVKRPDGESATPDEWASRQLPQPTSAFAFVGMCDCDTFSGNWAAYATKLGIAESESLCVLADGASWIWNAASVHLSKATGVLDIYHACEHIAQAARVLHEDQTEQAAQWTERVRGKLISGGWGGLCEALAEDMSGELTAEKRAAMEGLLGYFAAHKQHVGYKERLQAGRAIGSGAVEGLAKRMGRRMKCGSRGWIDKHVDPMATLVCAVQTPEWDLLWTLVA